MKLIRPQICHSDLRGNIKDLFGPTDAVTYIESVKGSIRGNHFHRETTQAVYVLSGEVRYLTRLPRNLETVPIVEQPIIETILLPGDLCITEPGEAHAMEALLDSAFLVFTNGPRSGEGYGTDTYQCTLIKRDVDEQTAKTR